MPGFAPVERRDQITKDDEGIFGRFDESRFFKNKFLNYIKTLKIAFRNEVSRNKFYATVIQILKERKAVSL